MIKTQIVKRILSIICATVLILAQFAFVLPSFEENQVCAADGSLEVRVQYEGWREDKIPTKANFSRNELNSIGNKVYYYANVTDVATVMRTVAKGPTVTSILNAAGIDRGSVKYIVFRTTDGNGKDSRFSLNISPNFYESNRWYYPNLNKNFDQADDDDIICPRVGSLSNAESVPAIIAISYFTTKNPNSDVNEAKLVDETYFRFCLGQTELTEGQWTKPGYDGDATSEESIQHIFGIDVVLKGSPISGITLNLSKDGMVVGTMTKIKVSASGDSLFTGDITNENLEWSSSDTSVAEVSKNGTVTIVGKGQATITAVAPDGTVATLLIDTNAKNKKTAKTSTKSGNNNATAKSVQVGTIQAKELELGDQIEVMKDKNQENGTAIEQVTALGEAENYGQGALYGTIGASVCACGIGFGLRLRKYKLDKFGKIDRIKKD